MATTTTNFGWDIPQSTDLVKDGATAIAALGQDIDTALVDLKGGTTGQVLAKASNTDLDFTWSNDAGISPTIFDAKGDLIVASAADTAARLPVGTNGFALVADSTQSLGVKWAAVGGGTWSSVASGSLSGSAINVTGLSGKKYMILLKSASHNGAPGYDSFSLRFNNDSGNNYVVIGGNGNTSSIASDSINGNKTLNICWFVEAADATTTPKFVTIAASGQKNPDGSDSYFGQAGGLYIGTSAITQINLFMTSQTFDNGTYEIWSLS